MRKQKKEIQKKATMTEKKSMLTTFLLLFPSMIISILAAANQDFLMSLIVIALFCYQAILLKNFVTEHYSFE